MSPDITGATQFLDQSPNQNLHHEFNKAKDELREVGCPNMQLDKFQQEQGSSDNVDPSTSNTVCTRLSTNV